MEQPVKYRTETSAGQGVSALKAALGGQSSSPLRSGSAPDWGSGSPALGLKWGIALAARHEKSEEGGSSSPQGPRHLPREGASGVHRQVSPYPDEVAHCHRSSSGCRGARAAAVSGGENAEHELEGQDELHRHRLANRGTAPDLCRGTRTAGGSGLCPG